MEALIGACFLDHGLDAARALVLRAWEPFFEDANCSAHHPKSAVQEWALGRGLKTPSYELVQRSGPHHSPRFHVRLLVPGAEPVDAEGGSKQEAETRAAQRFLDLKRAG
jgi:ribonuclease-3